jgi:chromosome segregation ATPase
MLLAEAGGSGEQVNAELQQLRECFAKLVASQEQITKERDAMAAAYHDSCIRGEQVNAELQQLREQVATLTQKLKDANDTYQLCLQSHYKAGQRSTIDRLQTWLRPVLEVVSDHPDNTSILAASVLEFLPQIASRLIEE